MHFNLRKINPIIRTEKKIFNKSDLILKYDMA